MTAMTRRFAALTLPLMLAGGAFAQEAPKVKFATTAGPHPPAL